VSARTAAGGRPPLTPLVRSRDGRRLNPLLALRFPRPRRPRPRPPPGPGMSAVKDEDIVDEALRLFRANVLFRNFEVQGGGDRVLVYLTLFIHQVRRFDCLCGGAAGRRAAVCRARRVGTERGAAAAARR
jgi:hypothetical protein